MLNVGIFCFQMTFGGADGADGGGPDCPNTAADASAAAFVSIADSMPDEGADTLDAAVGGARAPLFVADAAVRGA